ncbi:CDP-glycerol glycerophosphotransferase family protein [Brochothrix campestris]|uniref:CDP-glycerol glycerophosphotransferase family protein n=2 Tax=Brochothrix campestris TaxID=2757 RepID=UPI0038D0D00C
MTKLLQKYRKNKVKYNYAKWYFSKKIEKKTVLFESTHGRSIHGHIFYMMKDIEKNHPEYKVYVASQNVVADRSFLKNNGFTRVIVVEHLSAEYHRLLTTVELLVNDTSFFPFFNKKEGQKYVIVWHGTPLKHMGKDMAVVTDVANVQRNFYMADQIVVSNEYTKDILVETYHLKNVYSGEFVIAPSPRNAILFDQMHQTELRTKLKLKTKKIIFYMPTWRGDVGNVNNDNQKVAADLAYIAAHLEENTMFYVKLHPFQSDIDISEFPQIRLLPTDVELYAFIAIVDVLITDYSSIMYDFINTKKDIILYTHDLLDYQLTRGLYEDVASYPFYQTATIEGVMARLSKQATIGNYEAMSQRFCQFDYQHGSHDLMNYILMNKTSPKIISSKVHNGKETVVILSGGFWDNGITSALLNTLENIDTSERNYICFFGKNKVKKEHFYKLKNLPENVQFYPVPGSMNGTLIQRLINSQYMWKEWFKFPFINKILAKIYQAEYQRVFGTLKVDWFIHYTGFERKYAEMVRHMNHKTVMYVHTDMFQEYEAKQNFSKKVVFGAYQSASKVVLVHENLREELVEKIAGIADKVIVVNNFLGEERVRRFAAESLIASLVDVPVDYSFNEERMATDNYRKAVLLNDLVGTHTNVQNGQLLLNGQAALTANEQTIFTHVEQALTGLEKTLAETFPTILNPENKLLKALKEEQPDLHYPNKFIVDQLRISKLRLLEFIADEQITVFMNIGRYDYQKGHDRLIEAFERNYEQNNQIALVLVCPHGVLKKETIEKVRQSSARENIIILGGMRNPYVLLKAIDAFVLSSHYEGLGLVVYEALAVGTDVITVNLTETITLLQNNEALIVENTEMGITQGITDYLGASIDLNAFDFEAPKAQSREEFTAIFKS